MKRLTPAMKRRMIPFLPKLIRHWLELVETDGNPDSECPLCMESDREGGYACEACPVWSRTKSSCLPYLPDGALCGGKPAQRVLDFLLRLQKQVREAKAKQKGEGK